MGDCKRSIDERPLMLKIKCDRHAKSALKITNRAIMAIKNRLNDKLTLAEVNKLFYATASAVSDILGIKIRRRGHKKTKQTQWKKIN